MEKGGCHLHEPNDRELGKGNPRLHMEGMNITLTNTVECVRQGNLQRFTKKETHDGLRRESQLRDA